MIKIRADWNKFVIKSNNQNNQWNTKFFRTINISNTKSKVSLTVGRKKRIGRSRKWSSAGTMERNIKRLETLQTINLPRYSDASRNDYTTAIYLLIEIEGKLSLKFVFLKSRIAPKNLIWIPRLELLGVLIGVRSFKLVLENLKLPVIKKILWTVLQCVLWWIKETDIGINWKK